MNTMWHKRFDVLVFSMVILVTGCLDPYAAPNVNGSGNYLVISGFLNASDSSCSITLSRSLPLSSTDVPTPVSDATVAIEDSNGNSFSILQQTTGVYTNLNLPLSSQLKYRLHIVTGNGKSYRSDYVSIALCPPIDTVGWTLGRVNNMPTLNIYVSTHGSGGGSPYYLWNFEETWEYKAAFRSQLKVVNGQVVTNDDNNYYCWRTLPSTDILIASAKQLSQNVVNQFQLTSIPANSVKLLDGYSILVTQQSLTEGAFEYWQQLKATTENLGTIFGPLPSQLSGNIHSETNVTEPVFGYFSATSVSQKRIFIKPGDFASPGYVVTGNEDCITTMVPADQINDIGADVIVSSYGVGPIGYLVTSVACTDCRLNGGVNVKPSFWYY
ncbi:MAG TPA: DUF4249 domain-containing protein [Cyclobacteriaceae bacterium]|nr:DUF4249 domain-containing protein [Cyclobacteriaceae bacterium]